MVIHPSDLEDLPFKICYSDFLRISDRHEIPDNAETFSFGTYPNFVLKWHEQRWNEFNTEKFKVRHFVLQTNFL